MLDYRLGHRGLPLGPVAVALANMLWLPALALIPLIILLFPDGYLRTPRWRWAVWAYAGLVACVAVVGAANAIAPARYDADQTIGAFAARLKDVVDVASVQTDLANVVYQVLEPTHISVWIGNRE